MSTLCFTHLPIDVTHAVPYLTQVKEIYRNCPNRGPGGYTIFPLSCQYIKTLIISGCHEFNTFWQSSFVSTFVWLEYYCWIETDSVTNFDCEFWPFHHDITLLTESYLHMVFTSVFWTELWGSKWGQNFWTDCVQATHWLDCYIWLLVSRLFDLSTSKLHWEGPTCLSISLFVNSFVSKL